MKIELYKPEFFREKGGKDNQEDNFVVESPDNRYFILCDGMGGHEKGEVASETVCIALSEYFAKRPPAKFAISEEYINNAVEYAYQKLDEKDVNPESLKKMGTTMTCVYFGNNGILVAHIGDSRVYQIRPSDYTKENYENAVKIETKDHSLVRQLIDLGQITEEEAKTHPRRNVILKCMQPNEEDPDMPEFDSNDVKPDDYFFLCSDGILENITTKILCEILSEDITDSEKIIKLKSYCDNKTYDNYTCILLHVKKGKMDKIELLSEENEETDEPHIEVINQHTETADSSIVNLAKQNSSKILITAAVFSFLFLFFANIGSCIGGCNGDSQCFIEKVEAKYKAFYTRKPLGMGMNLFTKDSESILVNEKSEKIINLTDSEGERLLNGRKIQVIDLKISNFIYDSETKDTIAWLELTLSNNSNVKVTINSQGKIH